MMKAKLTVTLKKSVIDTARRMAESEGISLSKMIEEIFEETEHRTELSETGKAAERLLKRL